MEGWYLFIICTVISLVLGFVFLMMMCCCAGLVAWLLLFGLVLTFITFGVAVLLNVYYTGPLNNSVNALRVKYLSFMMRHKNGLVTMAIIFLLLGVTLLVYICMKMKDIKRSIPILSLASKSSLKNVLLVFLSFFIIMVQISVFFWELYVMLRIYTSGDEVHNNEDGNPFVNYDLNTWSKCLLAFHIFGTYWVIITLNNYNDFVCSAVTVNYYFQTKTTNMRVFCHTLGHNIGSVAWSIVLLPALIIKLFFGVFDYILTDDTPNCFQRLLQMVCCPCHWCYEKFVDVFSESYFSVTYFGSENFWPASKRFYYLSEIYHDETSVLFLMGSFFGLVGKTFISLLTGYFGYVIY